MAICLEVQPVGQPAFVWEHDGSDIRIGRDPTCELPFQGQGGQAVSWHHARLWMNERGLFVTDLNSSNGTFINGQRIQQTVALNPGDTIGLGQYGPRLRVAAAVRRPATAMEEITVAENPPAYPPPPPGSPPGSVGLPVGKRASSGSLPRLALTDRSLVLGRDSTCDRVLNYPMISRRHARLTRDSGGAILEDLDSSNGTFVNGQRIRGRVRVRTGDLIGLGSFAFTLAADGSLEQKDLRGHMVLSAFQITVRAGKKCLLDNVSLTIRPGEFVGLMGPSGAGKTTLMNALNGYTPPAAGRVLLNGQDLYEHYSQFASYIGYVPQDDIIHRDLTVGQALYYNARLRLPADFSSADIADRIDKVLQQLGLQGTKDVLIGSPEKKGISGGQRKRVNLAMELLTDPLILFLDEPTSGLSSEDALLVMKVLRQLADGGKTILLTIHQPSLEVFRLMDNLVLVGKDAGSTDPGRMVYYGPTCPDSMRFFNPGSAAGTDNLSPDDVLRGFGKRKTEEWLLRYHGSPYYRDFVQQRAAQPPPGLARHERQQRGAYFSPSQWLTLAQRCLNIKVKDTWNTVILLAQAPIIALLVVLVFAKPMTDEVKKIEDFASVNSAVAGTSFLLVLAALWFGCSNSAREIVGEWAIYRRERMVGLGIGSYFASKFTVLGGLCLLQCVILLSVVYGGCALRGPWLSMFGVLVLVSLVGVAIGLLVSVLARTSEVAIALLPLVLLPMVILGGILRPVHKMDVITAPMSQVMPSRWGFEGMLLLESKERPLKPDPPALPLPKPPVAPIGGPNAPPMPPDGKPDALPKPPDGKPDALPPPPVPGGPPMPPIGKPDVVPVSYAPPGAPPTLPESKPGVPPIPPAPPGGKPPAPKSEPAPVAKSDDNKERDDMAEAYFPAEDHRSGLARCVQILSLELLLLLVVGQVVLRCRDVRRPTRRKNAANVGLVPR
jgi:ABC-type multidrug transport system ATPase subunit/pSer/pThr/pTyr-binding forkhead associated (FHA) protein